MAVPLDPCEVVTRYLGAVAGHDWEAASECLNENVLRVGPYGDTFTSRTEYMGYLADLMPRLPGYSMRVDRVRADGPVVMAELAETVEMDGTPRVTPECIVFDLDQDDLITRIAVYTQRLGAAPGS